jgi:hypothetical protein
MTRILRFGCFSSHASSLTVCTALLPLLYELTFSSGVCVQAISQHGNGYDTSMDGNFHPIHGIPRLNRRAGSTQNLHYSVQLY